jgi:hypothetical protein
MKRIALLLLVLIALGGCCCLSDTEKAKVHENRVAMEAFVKMVDDGQTTREQEKKMLRVNLKNWLALDYAINEDAEAKKALDAMVAEEKKNEGQ